MKEQKGSFRHLVTAMSVPVWFLTGMGCSKTETVELSTHGLYAVLEVTPLRGTVPEGSRLGPVRVMVVEPRFDAPLGKQLEAEGFAMDCPAPPRSCDAVAHERGGLVLRMPGTHVPGLEDLSSWEVGGERGVRGKWLNFTTLERGVVLALSGPEEAPAEARVKLLKKCEVRVLQVKYASRESASSGIFSYAKTVPRSWVEVSRPRCFDASDREVELLSSEESEHKAAEDSLRKEEERAQHGAWLAEANAKSAEASAFRAARRAAMESAADAWAAQHPPESMGWEALSPLERKLNPKAAGYMHAGQLAKLSLKWRCLRRGSGASKRLFGSSRKQGSCKKHGYVFIVEWTGGVRSGVGRRPRETGSWSKESRADTLAELFTRVWVDEHGWLRIERPQRFDRPARSWVTEPSEEKVVDELQETLTFLAFYVPPPGHPDHARMPRPESWSFFEVGDGEDEPPEAESSQERE
jgi:hypothetical protein